MAIEFYDIPYILIYVSIVYTIDEIAPMVTIIVFLSYVGVLHKYLKFTLTCRPMIHIIQ